MISNKKSSKPSRVKEMDVSTVLSRNMLGYVCQFVKLNSLASIGKVNTKFKKKICDKNKVPLFNVYLEERRNSRSITDMEEVFCAKDTEISFLASWRIKLIEEDKYTSSQIIDFETEIINCLLKRLCPQGELNLRWCDFGLERDNFKSLTEALKVNQTVTSLNLSDTKLELNSENMENLSDALKVNRTLTTLNLTNNFLGEDAENIKNLSDALKTNKALTTLNLSGACLGRNAENMENISDALKVNKTLTSLDLGGNDLGENWEEDMQNLCDALKVNRTLTTLDLSDNELGQYEGDIKHISDALEVNQTLTALDLSLNEFDEFDEFEIKRLTKFKKLKLSI